jgi:hypothetical protein
MTQYVYLVYMKALSQATHSTAQQMAIPRGKRRQAAIIPVVVKLSSTSAPQ